MVVCNLPVRVLVGLPSCPFHSGSHLFMCTYTEYRILSYVHMIDRWMCVFIIIVRRYRWELGFFIFNIVVRERTIFVIQATEISIWRVVGPLWYHLLNRQSICKYFPLFQSVYIHLTHLNLISIQCHSNSFAVTWILYHCSFSSIAVQIIH